MATKREDIRKVDIVRAAVYLYNGYLPYRVEVFDNDSPFLYFFVPLFDFQEIESECSSTRSVELKSMIDSMKAVNEYVRKARPSGVYIIREDS
jgi:hypothetical protein